MTLRLSASYSLSRQCLTYLWHIWNFWVTQQLHYLGMLCRVLTKLKRWCKHWYPQDLGEIPSPVSPQVSALRRAVRTAMELCKDSPGPTPQIQSSMNIKAKLSLAEFRALKDKFVQNFPGELLTPANTPSLAFLILVRDQWDAGTLGWIPWRARVTEQQELQFQESRKPRNDNQLIQNLLSSADLMEHAEATVPSGGPVEPALLKFQSVLANALAMIEAVHLIVIKRFHHKFAECALLVPRDGSLRPPTLPEVLDADRSVWTAVNACMRDNNWSLADTLNEIAFCRQDIQASLQPRLKFASVGQPDREVPPKKKPKLTGKEKPEDNPRPKDGKKTESFHASWFRKHKGTGICIRWNTSKCGAGDACRYLHVCPVPKADGTICAGKHTAKAHKGSPH